MSQFIYILHDTNTVSIAETIDSQVVSNGLYPSKNAILTEEIICNMANSCLVDYFYVIVANNDISFPEFDFSFKPPSWDEQYTHIWNEDPTVRLFNKKQVLKNPTAFTDESLHNGQIKLKNINKKIYEHLAFDIIFLSYDESDADNNFAELKSRFPRTKRIHGIKGIHEAHKAAAKISETTMFYVVDADAEIVPDFEFSYHPDSYNINSVHVWHSKNPVNDLEYGYGGVKLFPTHKVLSYTGSPIDFTMSVSDQLKVIEVVANITHFDTDPFSTWRSAFRECVKLSTGFVNGVLPEVTVERLRAWQTIGNGEYGDFSISGANEGAQFGKIYINQPDTLKLINDFGWLENKFNS